MRVGLGGCNVMKDKDDDGSVSVEAEKRKTLPLRNKIPSLIRWHSHLSYSVLSYSHIHIQPLDS